MSHLERAAAFASNHEGEVFARVLVPVLQAGTPHHDAIVQQRAVAFAQAVHLFHHVSELGDVERGDGLDLRVCSSFAPRYRARRARKN